jgi:hypothetical protein
MSLRICDVPRWQVWVLEKFGIAPKGSSEVSGFLETGADALVEGGKCVVPRNALYYMA